MPADGGIADPTTEAFWAACRDRKLLVQRCRACGHHQFYPRPLCLACESTDLGWVESKGEGEIYSITTVRVPVTDELPPPYLLAIVALDEGPRLLTNIDAAAARIGDRVVQRVDSAGDTDGEQPGHGHDAEQIPSERDQ